MKKTLFTLTLILTACLSHAQSLYSTTSKGGNSDNGTICKLDLATNTITAVFSFGGANGATPYGSLIQVSDGKLYGMTYGGGSSGAGVIFSYNPSTATYVKLLDFDNTNGANPHGGLVQASDGKLYGTTYGGGSSGAGVIFSYDPATATYTKLLDFDNTNGAYPTGNLIQASDGKLYGATNQGGFGYGVIFSYDPSTATYTKLKGFNGTDGAYPGGLIQASNGKLYGTTAGGGRVYYDGVIFYFDPATATYITLKEFDFNDGSTPEGNLIQASDGKLYGMTAQGGGSDGFPGVIFSYRTATFHYAILHYFDVTSKNGATPLGGLMQASNGKLYGMTNFGGVSNLGVSFSFDPVTGTYTKLADFTGSNGSYPHASFVEGCAIITWYRDADGDGFGDLNNSTTRCSSTTPPGYVTNSSDCNDTKLLYADNDHDGYGTGSPVACGVANNTDCNDSNAAVHPGAVEICGNGIDDNCNGQVDEGCTISAVQISIADKLIVEGNAGSKLIHFDVTLNRKSTKIVTVKYATQDGKATAGSDYIAKSGTLIFPPDVKSIQLTVSINGDKTPEANETFRVVLSNPVNAVIADGAGTGTILNDDGSIALQPIAQNQDAASAALKDFKLSPNPANDKVNLMLTGYSGNLMIELLDINGKMLQEKKVISLSKLSQQQIDISNYPDGVYLVTVIDEKGNRKTQKLVISR